MIEQTWNPILMVVSAPSGAGKTTLCDRLKAEFSNVAYSVSCTTRPPREGEVDGRSYYFIEENDFNQRVEAGEFLEHATVHGYFYGTLRQEVLEALNKGLDVLMDIDVQGSAQIRKRLAEMLEGDPLKRSFVDVFIAPPSLEDLQMRLFGRGKDETETIDRRLKKATEEMDQYREYSYLIVNDNLDESYDTLRAIFLAEHARVNEIS